MASDFREGATLARWWLTGREDLPPPALKRRTIRRFGRRHRLRTLVETGTYLGDTIAAVRDAFDVILSVELSEELHARAVERFADDPGIVLHQGDGGVVLPRILDDLAEPCLFWIDSHWSGGVTARGDKDTPVVEELTAVFSHRQDHVVLVDDARLFTGADGYPTLQELTELIGRLAPDAVVSIRHDIIRIFRPT